LLLVIASPLLGRRKPSAESSTKRWRTRYLFVSSAVKLFVAFAGLRLDQAAWIKKDGIFSSLLDAFVTIINPVYLCSCTVNIWVELKSTQVAGLYSVVCSQMLLHAFSYFSFDQ
jgi:hypothetical protein